MQNGAARRLLPETIRWADSRCRAAPLRVEIALANYPATKTNSLFFLNAGHPIFWNIGKTETVGAKNIKTLIRPQGFPIKMRKKAAKRKTTK